MQIVQLEARELDRMKIEAPDDMPPETPITLYGGAALIFDEYGRVKFSINNRLDHQTRQTRRLAVPVGVRALRPRGRRGSGGSRTCTGCGPGPAPESIREEWH